MRSHTVRSVAGLVTHQGEVALVGLNDCWRLKVIFVPSMDDFIKCGNVLVV